MSFDSYRPRGFKDVDLVSRVSSRVDPFLSTPWTPQGSMKHHSHTEGGASIPLLCWRLSNCVTLGGKGKDGWKSAVHSQSAEASFIKEMLR